MKRKIKLDIEKNRKWDSAFSTIPGWNPEKIKSAKVMVVGAGALGNEVLKNLTLLNVGQLVIVDFDLVEYSNLAKSILFKKTDTGSKKAEAIARNLKEINDSVKTLSIIGDIGADVGLGVFRRMDVVIGCLDNRLARLNINRQCFKVNKTWVDGGIENLSGRFNVYTPEKSCYECGLTDHAWEIIKFRMGCPDIAKRNASNGVIATTPVSSSIIAGFQVLEALKIIFGNYESSIAGEGFQFKGMINFFLKFKQSGLKEDCDSHVLYENIIEAKELSHNNTVKETLDWIESNLGTSAFKIIVNEDIVLEAIATNSGKSCHPVVFKNRLLASEEVIQLHKDPDEDLFIPEDKAINWIDKKFPYQEKTLKQIGIPFLEILKVEANEDIYFVELTGDEKHMTFN